MKKIINEIKHRAYDYACDILAERDMQEEEWENVLNMLKPFKNREEYALRMYEWIQLQIHSFERKERIEKYCRETAIGKESQNTLQN